MAEVKKYTINVPQAKLDRLTRRLEDAEFPEEIEDGGSTYGVPVSVNRNISQEIDKANH